MTRRSKQWEVVTAVGRVLDSHDDYVYALQLAQYQAAKLGFGVWLVKRGASLNSAEHVA